MGQAKIIRDNVRLEVEHYKNKIIEEYKEEKTLTGAIISETDVDRNC